MHHVGLYAKPSNQAMAAIGMGVEALGLRPYFRNPAPFGDDQVEGFDLVVVVGMARQGRVICDIYSSRGVPVAVVDSPFILRGQGFFRFCLNCIDWIPDTAPPDRAKEICLEAHPTPKKKKTDPSGHVLVCGQKAGNCHNDIGFEVWKESTLDGLGRLTDRQIIYRPHPKVRKPDMPIAEALANAHCMVTYNSSVAYEAFRLGVPVLCDPCAAYSELANTDISNIETPGTVSKANRQKLLDRVACAQWTRDEFATGRPLKFFMEAACGI